MNQYEVSSGIRYINCKSLMIGSRNEVKPPVVNNIHWMRPG